jgi:hypothetical protein
MRTRARVMMGLSRRIRGGKSRSWRDVFSMASSSWLLRDHRGGNETRKAPLGMIRLT